ncbi:hypothetical protein EVAR_74025_1, partial [Eumeta japonica]
MVPMFSELGTLSTPCPMAFFVATIAKNSRTNGDSEPRFLCGYREAFCHSRHVLILWVGDRNCEKPIFTSIDVTVRPSEDQNSCHLRYDFR